MLTNFKCSNGARYLANDLAEAERIAAGTQAGPADPALFAPGGAHGKRPEATVSAGDIFARRRVDVDRHRVRADDSMPAPVVKNCIENSEGLFAARRQQVDARRSVVTE
jgi:hypothetical protein